MKPAVGKHIHSMPSSFTTSWRKWASQTGTFVGANGFGEIEMHWLGTFGVWGKDGNAYSLPAIHRMCFAHIGSCGYSRPRSKSFAIRQHGLFIGLVVEIRRRSSPWRTKDSLSTILTYQS